MSNDNQNSLEDFLGKIDWEGGVTGALDYGINVDDYDLPVAVAEKWEELEQYFAEFEDAEADFWAAVKSAE